MGRRVMGRYGEGRGESEAKPGEVTGAIQWTLAAWDSPQPVMDQALLDGLMGMVT